MARHAPMQQRETASTTTTRETRPRRPREERQQQRATVGSNQRNLRKQQRAEKTPDPDSQASEIATLLRDDADDQSGQARARLESLPENERAEVTARLQSEMSESDMQRAAPALAQPAPNVIQPQPGQPAQKKEDARAKEAEPAVEDEPLVEEQVAEEAEEAQENEEAQEEKKEASKKTRKRVEPAALRPVPVAEKEAPEPAPEGEAPAPEDQVSEETKAPAETGAPAEAAAVPAAAPAEGAKAPATEAKPAAAAPAAASPVAAGGPAPATAAAPAALAGGGGGGGGGGEAATLDEAPPESAEAEETEEKMAEAEPETDDTESAEPEPRDEDLSADKAMEDAEKEPPSQVEEQAKAAEEEEAAARTGGGEEAAPEEADEEDAPPAGAVELPAEEREAALGSISEDVGGGGGEPGGGGGGGGGAAEEATAEEPPDVSSAPPAEAMATVSSLKVGQIAGAISSVSASVSNKVTEEKSDLAANAPSMERPSGAPQTKDGHTEAEGGEGGAAAEGVEEVAAEGETPSAEDQLEPLAEPGPDPTAQVAAPRVSGGGEGGTMSAADVENLESAIEDLPTTDPALEETAGPPPTVELVGEADPTLAAEQRTQLEETTAGLEAEGAEEAAKPMGEDELYPVVPEETLTAKIEGGEGGADGASVEVDDDTAAIVAEEEEGDSVRAEATAAQAEMTAAEGDHESEVATKNAEHETAVEAAVAANEEQQTARRNSAKSDVEAKRGEWTSEQRAMVDKSRGDADAAMEESDATVEREQTSADERAELEIEKGNEEAAAARKDAERDAKKEKDSADSEGGFFDWVASAATSFFNGLKAAIGAIFDAARALVKGAIELAQKAAAAIIDAARDAIIAGIRLAGDACMFAADFLLAGFPELRDRVKGAIQDTVSAAEDAVNELADNLKRGVQELLDALGKALDAALSLLEKGLMAAVDAVAAAVEGAIKAAKAAIAALALFATLIKDIAADPGGWISNLGAAILDGIQNHLWKELKAAVKAWFNAKLDSMLGIGTAIWDVLTKGKITAAQIGKMAFEALKTVIPMMLIQLIVEKVASMIVPAFGAVMVIVESLQAAWGAISAIITAIGKFIDFLKAVRGGGAGPQFAQALAAGAVAVIEFVSSFLLVKLIGPAKKVGGKVKAMAGRIMAKLKKIGQKIARAAKKVVGKIKKVLKKVGKKLGFGKKKKKSRTKKDKEKATDRLDKAVRELRPKITSLASKQVSGVRLRAMLLMWRVKYRLTRLAAQRSGGSLSIEATANPSRPVIENLVNKHGQMLMRMIRNAGFALFKEPDVIAAMQEIHANRQAGYGETPDDPLAMPPDLAAQALDIRTNVPGQWVSHYQVGTSMRPSQHGEFRLPVASAGALHTMNVTPQGGSYDAISAAASPLGSGPFAQALRSMSTTGRLSGVPATSANRQLIGGTSRILAAEFARDPGHIGRTAIGLDSLDMGLSVDEFLKGKNPMSLKTNRTETGGARTAYEINSANAPRVQPQVYGSQLTGAKAANLPGRMNQFMAMERDLLIDWMERRMLTGDPIFDSEERLERYILKEMRAHLKEMIRTLRSNA